MEVSDRENVALTETEPFYVLIVGNDSRIGTVSIEDPYYADGSGRSDTIILARIDPATYLVTLVSVPRDTACTIDGQTVKINEAYRQGGIKQSVEEVEKLTGATIKYYFDTGFVQFEEMVNSWGGVTANVPVGFSMGDAVTGEPVTIGEGEQVLDGSSALAFARMRKDYREDHDASRQIQDRQLVQNAIQQTAADPARVAADLAALLSNTETNWPKESLIALADDFAANADSIRFYSGTGPYKGDIDESAGGLWLATRDEDSWRQIMKVVGDGGDPTTVLALPAVAPAE